MNYIEQIAESLREKDITDGYEYQYALLVLVKGDKVTNSDVHDAWSLLENQTNPEHPSLIPYSKLTEEKKAKDQHFRNIIQEVAREFNMIK